MKYSADVVSPIVAPYGSWRSPITADLVTAQIIGLSELTLDGGFTYWLEQRPNENGRSVVVRRAVDGTVSDMMPPPYNCRTRVHEYGGGSYLAVADAVYFSNFADNCIYIVEPNGDLRQLTPPSARRFADILLDQPNDRLICICEDHSVHSSEPMNTLASVSLRDGSVVSLASGADFYASPATSPDGSKVAWIQWNHPLMPWDGCELHVAEILADGSLTQSVIVAGGTTESIFQPSWSPSGELYYVSDRNGWWNLYRQRDAEIGPVWSKDAEFGLPQWVFGQSTYGFAGEETVMAAYQSNGIWNIAAIETTTGRVTVVDTPFTTLSYVASDSVRCCFIGGSNSRMPEVIELDISTGKYQTLKASSSVELLDRYISAVQSISFETSDGARAYGAYYAPKNDDYTAPGGELPPLLVGCHGGPTSASGTQLSLTVQYWTSRGFAYVNVNYGGSTGYGREYRERLTGKWGLVDVDDAVDCALYLADTGAVDANRLTIHGGSAGGYTALCALTFHAVFAAGASLYGVSNLEALAKDTHKFESRYLDKLIAPYPAGKAIYLERSPIHFAEKLSSPVIFFQGLDDKVVPPDQAEKMIDALTQRGIRVAYLPFEGEGHGFRKSESIKKYLDAHLRFYADVFGITVANPD